MCGSIQARNILLNIIPTIQERDKKHIIVHINSAERLLFAQMWKNAEVPSIDNLIEKNIWSGQNGHFDRKIERRWFRAMFTDGWGDWENNTYCSLLGKLLGFFFLVSKTTSLLSSPLTNLLHTQFVVKLASKKMRVELRKRNIFSCILILYFKIQPLEGCILRVGVKVNFPSTAHWPLSPPKILSGCEKTLQCRSWWGIEGSGCHEEMVSYCFAHCANRIAFHCERGG